MIERSDIFLRVLTKQLKLNSKSSIIFYKNKLITIIIRDLTRTPCEKNQKTMKMISICTPHLIVSHYHLSSSLIIVFVSRL